MTYSNLFQNTLSFPTPIIVILVFIFAVMLYHSIFFNIFSKLVQQIFFSANNFTSLSKTYLYVVLINFPLICLILISIIKNDSILGLQIALTADQVYIFVVTGYICWIQESRHTPIRGIFLIRDMTFALISMALLFDVYFQGNIGFDVSSTLIGVLFVYHIMLSYFEKIEDLILRVFGLKQQNNFNSKFLLTSKHVIPDFLQIKDIITQKKKDIQQDLEDFKEILVKVQSNQEDQQIIMKFAKLYLPIKKATQLKDKFDKSQILNQICQQWDQVSQESQQQSEDQEDIAKNISRNDSGDQMAFNKDSYTYTYTSDFVQQNQNSQPQISKYQNFLKYLFYPVFIVKKVEGRLKYFVFILAIGAIIILMYMISNASNYYEVQIKSSAFISVVVSLSLIYPSADYFVKISSKNDFDFTNIFLVSIILKVAFFSTGTLIYSLFFAEQLNFRIGSISALLARIISLGIFLVFMIIKRFATRYSNFKFFVILFTCSCVARIIAQNVINSQNS